MRATADRMEAIIADRWVSDEEALERVSADVEVFVKAIETIDRELLRLDAE